MRIGRKEALLALVATMVPWIGRKANAQIIRDPVKDPTAVRTLGQAQEIADLQRRVAALETQLASQVGFTKDASGNLLLRGNMNVTIMAGFNMSIRASSALDLNAGGATTIKGATLALN